MEQPPLSKSIELNLAGPFPSLISNRQKIQLRQQIETWQEELKQLWTAAS